jgi:hypothetical protein
VHASTAPTRHQLPFHPHAALLTWALQPAFDTETLTPPLHPPTDNQLLMLGMTWFQTSSKISGLERNGGKVDQQSVNPPAADRLMAAPAPGDSTATVTGGSALASVFSTLSASAHSYALGPRSGMLRGAGGKPAGELPASLDSAAERVELLVKSGGGGALIGPIDGAESAVCPKGVAPQRDSQQTALVVMAGAGSAGRLHATMEDLLQRLERADEDVRGLFHVYIAVVSI